VQLFSKEALRSRKTSGGPEPAWLDDYMKDVWVPAESSQLRFLQKALNPHVSLFTSVYLPIRNNVYAHRLMSDDRAGAELFPKTNREEIGKTLNFLQELVAVVQDLYSNGNEPKLGERDLSDSGKRIRTGVEKVLRKLANASH
jgi:AbiU2